MRILAALCAGLLVLGGRPALAQSAGVPSEPGQAAYATISEIVRLLAADPATDWSRVDLEGLRQHLIDMDEVTMHARAVQEAIPGGARMVVTGQGAARSAIRRMTRAHAASFGESFDLLVQVREHPEGVVLTVTARRPGDAGTEARIRGLGFIGFMTLADHHGPHHLALAGGSPPPGHAHH